MGTVITLQITDAQQDLQKAHSVVETPISKSRKGTQLETLESGKAGLKRDIPTPHSLAFCPAFALFSSLQQEVCDDQR